MKNIFISSTFIDMQAERDLVQERVVPALREVARKYGENIGTIDLRWGVDTSTLETEEGAAKVLKVCLDEIDRSHPYMLIFLGERYGTVMREDQIQKAISNRADKYETEDFVKSITALEVEYGALSQKYGELDRCIVCFRDPVVHMMDGVEKDLYVEREELGRRKLQELKEQIAHDLGDSEHLISYSCTWDSSTRQLVGFDVNGRPLEEVLVEAYLKLFQNEWEQYESMSWQEKEQLAFHVIIENKLRSFVGRNQLLETYYQKILNVTCPVILQGEIGSGKTAIMCKLAKQMQEKGQCVFSFFAGVGSRSFTAEHFIQQVVYFLEKRLCIEEHFGEEQIGKKEEITYNKWKMYLNELIDRIPENERVYIFLDGLEQLYQDKHVQNLDFFIQREKIQFIISCSDSYKLPMQFVLERELMQIPALTKEETSEVLQGIFASYARNTYAEIEKEILKKAHAGNPLYLTVLIQRLNMLDAEELRKASTEWEIVSLGTEVIRQMPEQLEEAFVAVMYNAIEKVSEHKKLLREVLRYLAVSRRGLRMQDLQRIFERQGIAFPVLDFTLLMKYLDSFFYTQADDRINFINGLIRKEVRKEIADISEYEKVIWQYIKELPFDDTFRRKEGMYYARIFDDITLAKELIDAVIVNRKEFLEAVVAEGLADEGKFYCKVIESEADNDSNACDFFQDEVLKLYCFSKTDYLIRFHLSQALLEHLERKYAKYKTNKMLRRLIMGYEEMGKSSKRLGRGKEKVQPYYEKGLEYCHELQNAHDSIWVKEELSELYLQLGEIVTGEQALACFEKSIACYEECVQFYKKNGMPVTEEPMLYLKKANALRKLGQFDEALKYCEIAHGMLTNTEALNVGSCNYEMGEIFYAKDDMDKALEYYTFAVNDIKQICEIYKNDNLLRLGLEYQYAIGKVLYKKGEFLRSLDCCQEMIKSEEELLERGSVKNDGKIIKYYNLMQKILEELGREQELLDIAYKVIYHTKEWWKEANIKGKEKGMALFDKMDQAIRKYKEEK